MKKTLFILLLIFVTVSIPIYAKNTDASGLTKTKDKGKSIVGSVNQVTTNSIIVENKNDKNKNTEGVVDSTTKIIGKDKKNAKLGSIKLKDLVAFISTDSADSSKSGKIKVNKIYVKDASSSAQMKRRAVAGVITNISGNLITLAHQIQRDRVYQVYTSADTIITMKNNTSSSSASINASDSANIASLTVGMRIAAVGDLNEGGGILAKRIHVIPGKATGIFKRLPVSTPSASLVATPSANASSSAKPSLLPLPSSISSPTAIPSSSAFIKTTPPPVD